MACERPSTGAGGSQKVTGVMGPLPAPAFLWGDALQSSEQGMRGSDLSIHRLRCGEQPEGGKGSNRLGSGSDAAQGREGGGLDWMEAMDLARRGLILAQ